MLTVKGFGFVAIRQPYDKHSILSVLCNFCRFFNFLVRNVTVCISAGEMKCIWHRIYHVRQLRRIDVAASATLIANMLCHISDNNCIVLVERENVTFILHKNCALGGNFSCKAVVRIKINLIRLNFRASVYKIKYSLNSSVNQPLIKLSVFNRKKRSLFHIP